MSEYVRPAAVQWGDSTAGWSVFLILLAVYTATFSGLPDNPDAEVEFQTTSALVRTGSLALGGTPEAEGIVEMGFDVAPGVGARAGEHYAWFGVGQALAAVPLYLTGRLLALVWPEVEERHAQSKAYEIPRSEYFAHLLVGWRNPLLAALTGMLLVLTARRMGSSRPVAFTCGLTYGLCTFAWPQARSTLSDVQATLLLFGAFHMIVRMRESFARLSPPRTAHLWLTGAALGGAFLTRVATVPAVAVLTYAAWSVLDVGHRRLERSWGEGELELRRRRTAQRLDLFGPLVAAAVLWLGVNWLRFGNPLATGYESAILSGTFFSYPPHLGLAGLLVSPGKGLLWMAPGLLLLPFGLRQARRNDEHLWPWVLAAVAATMILPLAFTGAWHGAWTYGPRYLLPVLPFAWLGFGLSLESWRSRRWVRPVAGALCALGLLVQVPAALVDHMTHEDLGLQAARLHWPDVEGASEFERDEVRFTRMQWDWRFAAPWAHWRILRHRVAGLEDDFQSDEIFFVGGDALLEPKHAREEGYMHLAWVDLSERLHGSPWPGVVISILLLALGVILAVRGIDAARV